MTLELIMHKLPMFGICIGIISCIAGFVAAAFDDIDEKDIIWKLTIILLILSLFCFLLWGILWLLFIY